MTTWLLLMVERAAVLAVCSVACWVVLQVVLAGGFRSPKGTGRGSARTSTSCSSAVGREVVPDRCGVASWGDPCEDPPAVRIRTYCRAESVTDPTAPCTSWLAVCQAHRGPAATIVALRGTCALHGARVDVIGVEVL